MDSQTIQPSYQSFCRLTQNDDSSSFSFFFNLDRGQTKNQLEIKTTLNKARVISKKVDTHYQTDPTIQYIEINIPSNIIPKTSSKRSFKASSTPQTGQKHFQKTISS